MIFWKDIVFPIALAFLSLALIIFVLNLILRFFHIDFPIVRFVGVLTIWYYVGPIIYNLLIQNVLTSSREGIEILYNPIQSIIAVFEKLV